MVPHLLTALTGPINELEQRILESLPAIERFLMQRSDEIESFEGTRSALMRFGTGHS